MTQDKDQDHHEALAEAITESYRALGWRLKAEARGGTIRIFSRGVVEEMFPADARRLLAALQSQINQRRAA